MRKWPKGVPNVTIEVKEEEVRGPRRERKGERKEGVFNRGACSKPCSHCLI